MNKYKKKLIRSCYKACKWVDKLDRSMKISPQGVLFSLFVSLPLGFLDILMEGSYEKLPEVAILKAEEIIKQYPEAEKILAPLIKEAKNRDDGEDLAKSEALCWFSRLRSAEDGRDMAEYRVSCIRKKLGLS